jgi:V/A-type H+-transporting ATPase subunit E
MESKLQELTSKIYLEGVERAKTEGKDILDRARDEAAQIVANAKAEAERIVTAARNETDQLRARVMSEVKMAGNQAIAALKQEITNLVSQAAFAAGTKASFNDTQFVQDLIKEIVGQWAGGKAGADLNLILPEKSRTEMQKFFGAKTQEMLTKGLAISFDGRFENGFRIGPKDNSFVLSFTDKDFISLFQGYLKTRTREILFPGE